MQTEEQRQSEALALAQLRRSLDIRSVNRAICEERWKDADRWLDNLGFQKDDLSLQERIALYQLIGV